MRFNLFLALFRITRFWNLAIIGLAQYFTAYFLIDKNIITDWRLFILSSSTMLIAAAGYTINDYYDVKIDLINKPERVVVGKNIKRRHAILLHTILSSVGVFLGLLVGWKIAAINFLSSFFLWLYSNQLKRLPLVGNIVVATLTGLSVFVLSILYKSNSPLILIYSLFAFFITLVREVVKDMEDLKGDGSFGCKTLPIIWGIRKTKVFLYILIGVFSILVMVLNHFYSRLPTVYFLLFLFAPMGMLFIRLVRADTIKGFYQLSQFCKIIMVSGIISMVFV
jgi:4-hydroxybenzoate polyprenyltransferase